MLRKLLNKYWKTKNKDRNDVCDTCIWHKAEEFHGKPFKKGVRYCEYKDKYTSEHYSCDDYLEEKFTGDENSTQTEEIELNIENSIDVKPQ